MNNNKKKESKPFSLKVLLFLVSFLMGSMAFAQNSIQVSGTVQDELGPLPGVSVAIKGTTTGTLTDLDGNFTLAVPNDKVTLTFTFLGYVPQNIVVGSNRTLNVTMKSEDNSLDEVVVIGYGTVRKKDLTGSTVSVKGSAIANIPVTTAAQALAGKAAGVNIVQQSGAPGANVQITVRGGTSITQGTEPLYIVDGFQMENGLQNVDVNDIESIDVMKDASATAIYGARGSNGVVLITTKSGKLGKTEVSYNTYFSFNRLGKKLDLLSVEDYVKYQYEFNELRGDINRFANFFGGDVNAPDFYTGAYSRISQEYRNRAGIDWQDLVFGDTGVTQNHNINISGGGEKTKYMLSYNYTGEDGIMDKHNFQKNSIRAKINHELWKGVRFDFASSLQSTKVEGGGSLGGKLKQTILQPITGGEKWTNEQMIGSDIGTEIGNIMGDANYDAQNPILDNLAIDNEKYTRLATVNAGLEFDIMKNLMFRTAGSYSWKQVRKDYWDNGTTKQASANKSPYGYGSRDNSEKYSWQITNTLNYRFDIKDIHRFTALIGQETYYSEEMNLNNEYRSFSDGNFGLNDVSMGTPYTWKSGKERSGLVSVFGRLTYNYDDRYLFTGTLRGDGSSKFARGKQWDYFPSASAAWRISEEAFMANIKETMNQLKLRIGYGIAGNNNISNGVYATSYKAGHYGYNNSDYITYSPDALLGNPLLVWEKTTTTNIGLDMAWLNSRFNLSVDWYNNESNNLLIEAQIPPETGYSKQMQNYGSIRNRGVEFVLNTTNVVTKDFTWTTDFNISFNRSKVLKLDKDNKVRTKIQDYESRMGYKIEVGQPLGQFYGLIYDGVYTTDDFTQNADGSYTLKDDVPYLKGSTRSKVKVGDVKYRNVSGETDKNGHPVYSINDRTVIGNAQPKFTGGMNNTFRYKGFDLAVFFNFVYGNKVFNMSTQRFIGPYMANQNTLSKMANRFTLIDPETGKESTDLARLSVLNPDQAGRLWNISSNNKNAISDHSSYYLEDGSYLRLNNITLGYTLPRTLVQKVKINSVRVYGTLNNIHTFTKYSGYDPEVSASDAALTSGVDNSSYPRSKSWVLGINLTF